MEPPEKQWSNWHWGSRMKSLFLTPLLPSVLGPKLCEHGQMSQLDHASVATFSKKILSN